MTMEERKEIFAKEYLSIKDVEMLYGFNTQQASKFILAIKRKLTIGLAKPLRLDMQGKIHIQDYLDYMGISSDRYGICGGDKNEKEIRYAN